MEGIYCLMMNGRGLTDEIRMFLYRIACEMFKKGEEWKSVKSPDCEALVQTKFNFAMLGSIYGTKFVVDVETNNGKTHAEFIVHDRDLDKAMADGVWVPLMPTPEANPGRNAWRN